MDILKGDYINPHVSIWWYKLDSMDEINNPEMWIKANPNIGKTVSYETYQLDVERAEKSPENRNDILAKRFGIPKRTIEDWETGKRRAPAWVIAMLQYIADTDYQYPSEEDTH